MQYRKKIKKMFHDSENGYIALTSVVIIAAVVITIATTVSLLAIGEAQTAQALFKGEDTFQFIDGCMEDAAMQIRKNPAYAGGTITRPEGSCVITASNASSTWTVTATLSTTSYKRTMQSVMKRDVLMSVTSWKEM